MNPKIVAPRPRPHPRPRRRASRAEAAAEKIKTAIVLTDGATMIDFGPWEVFQDTHVPELGASMDQQMPFEALYRGRQPRADRDLGRHEGHPRLRLQGRPGARPGGDRRPARRAGAERLAGRPAPARRHPAFGLHRGGLQAGGDRPARRGKEATTHHDFFAQFHESFPKGSSWSKANVSSTRASAYTAGGLSSGIDAALHLVERAPLWPRGAARTAVYMEYQGRLENRALKRGPIFPRPAAAIGCGVPGAPLPARASPRQEKVTMGSSGSARPGFFRSGLLEKPCLPPRRRGGRRATWCAPR